MAAAPAVVGDLIIPLRSWMDIEAKKTPLTDPKSSPNHKKTCSKESIIRKATVAYGIVELLMRSDTNNNVEALDEDVVQIDNFAVHVSKKSSRQRHQLWDDIKGVSMIHPELALSIEEPAYLSCLMAPEEKQGQLGRYLEVELDAAKAKTSVELMVDASTAKLNDTSHRDKGWWAIDTANPNAWWGWWGGC